MERTFWSCLSQENAKDIEGKDIQDNDKTSNDLWSRDLGAEEDRREEAGKNRDENAEVDNRYIA